MDNSKKKEAKLNKLLVKEVNKLGLSYLDIAYKLGGNIPNITNWMTGRYQYSFKKLIEFGEKLEIDIDFIIKDQK